MKNRILISLLTGAMLSGAGSAVARELSAGEALQRYLDGSNGGIRRENAVRNASYTLERSVTSQKTQRAGAYVFTAADDSFVVLSADDSQPVVLGYGSGYNGADLPPALLWWLNQAAAGVDASLVGPKAGREAVAPLVKTTWDQGTPYNNLCPASGSQRTYTGCVATSTAQVANYHRWPVKGTGEHSITYGGKKLTFDYGATTFDWANMLDSYSGKYSTAQADAVATLMYGCGIGVDMSYSIYGSGALSLKIPYFLRDNMGYDKGAAMLLRDYYTAADWDDIIYGELAAGRPVIYGGQSKEGGHSFICDGYKSDGYYHINWGWSGVSDGYFLLTALDPDNQGAGGSGDGSGFNTSQDAIVGIQKPVEGSAMFLPLYAMDNILYDSSSYMVAFSRGIFNYSPVYTKYIPALRLSDKAGNEYFAEATPDSIKGVSGTSISGLKGFSPVFDSAVPAGSYVATPAARDPGSSLFQSIMVKPDFTNSLNVRKGKNGLVTFDGSDPDLVSSYVMVNSISQGSDLISGNNGYITVKYTNPGSSSVSNPIAFIFTNVKTGQVFTLGNYTPSVSGGSTITSRTRATILYPDGKYSVRAVNRQYAMYASDAFTLYIGVRPTSVKIDNTAADIEVGKTADLTATVMPSNAFDKSVTWSSSAPEIISVDANGTITAHAAGQAQITARTINDLEAVVTVTASIPSGIEGVDADSDARWYNMQGVEVKNPTNGIFIRVSAGKAAKVIL